MFTKPSFLCILAKCVRQTSLGIHKSITCRERKGPWWQVRLVEEDPSTASLGEAYEVNCARYGREPDLPIAHFKKRCCSPQGHLQPDPHGELRLQVRATLWLAFSAGMLAHSLDASLQSRNTAKTCIMISYFLTTCVCRSTYEHCLLCYLMITWHAAPGLS